MVRTFHWIRIQVLAMAMAYAVAIFHSPSALGRQSAQQKPTEAPLCTTQFRELLRHNKLTLLPPEKRLHKDSVILDTNVSGVIERLQSGAEVDPVHQEYAKALAQYLDVSIKELTQPRIRDFRYFYPKRTLTELETDRAKRGDRAFVGGSALLHEDQRLKPGIRNRISAQLEREKVGGSRGTADREIVTEVLMAEVEPGVVPVFVTGDRGIYMRLCSFSTDCRPFMHRPTLEEAFPKGFEIDIEGRKLRVVPMRLRTRTLN